MPRHHPQPHKLEKILTGKRKDWPVYKCILPGCQSTFIPNIIINRQVSCYDCDAVFTVGSNVKDHTKYLKCKDCRKLNSVDDKEVLDTLKKVLK